MVFQEKNQGYEWIILPFTLMSSLLILNLYPKQIVNNRFLETQITTFGLENTRLQMLNYALQVFLFCFYCLYLFLIKKKSFPVSRFQDKSVLYIFTISVFLLLFFLVSLFKFSLVLIVFLLLMLFSNKSLRNFSWEKFISSSFARIYLKFLCVAYLAFFYFFPFIFRLTTPRIDDFYSFQSHYSATVLPGFEWAEGNEVSRMNYGFWMTLAIGSALKFFEILQITSVSLSLIIKIYQLVAIGGLFLILYFLNKESNLVLLFLSLFLLSPYLTTAAVWAPNQSGLRYIPFLMGVALLTWIAFKGDAYFLPSGVLLGFLSASSPDVALPLFVGFVYFRILINYLRGWSSLFLIFDALRYFIIFVLSVLVFALFSKLFFNLAPEWSVLNYLKLFGGGYGGLSEKPSPIAGVLIGYASYFLFQSIWHLRRDTLTRIVALQSAFAMMIFAWFPYYINRMSESNLWFLLVLFLVMIAPSLKDFSSKLITTDCEVRHVISVFAIATMTVFTVQNSVPQVEYFKSNLLSQNLCTSKNPIIDSVCVTGEQSSQLADQVTSLRSIAHREDYLVLSRLPTHVRMLGFNQNFPWYDTMSEVVKDRDLAEVVNWIDKFGPKYLLLDALNTSSVYSVSSLRQQKNIVASLKKYKFVSKQKGWAAYIRL